MVGLYFQEHFHHPLLASTGDLLWPELWQGYCQGEAERDFVLQRKAGNLERCWVPNDERAI